MFHETCVQRLEEFVLLALCKCIIENSVFFKSLYFLNDFRQMWNFVAQ